MTFVESFPLLTNLALLDHIEWLKGQRWLLFLRSKMFINYLQGTGIKLIAADLKVANAPWSLTNHFKDLVEAMKEQKMPLSIVTDGDKSLVEDWEIAAMTKR